MTLSTSLRFASRDLRPAEAALVVAGRFNVAEIMGRAVAMARTLRSLPSWRARMALALRHVWKLAKREAAERYAHHTHTPAGCGHDGHTLAVRQPGEGMCMTHVPRAARVVRPRIHGFLRGARIHSHGW